MKRLRLMALVGLMMLAPMSASATLQVSTTDALSQYTSIINQLKNARSEALLLQAQIAGGTVNLENALSWLQDFAGLKAAQGAQGQNAALNGAVVALQSLLYGTSTAQITTDGAAEYTALGNLIVALRADVPKDAQSHPLVWVLGADGTLTAATAAGSAFTGTNAAITSFLNTLQ